MAGLDGFDQCVEAVALRRRIDEEVQQARDDERAGLAPFVYKDWRKAVGVITDLEGFDQIVAAGQAIRQAERDAAKIDLTEPPPSAAIETGPAPGSITMSEFIVPGSVAERVALFQAKRAAEGLPPLPKWLAVIESSDASPEAIEAHRRVEREIAQARAADRAGCDAGQ